MQNKYLNDFELLERVRQAVLRRNCSVTVGDIIAETGLNHDDARAALTALMATHEGTMHVSDTGELAYQFTDGCTLRDERSWGTRNKEAVFKLLKLSFKVVLAAVLIIYFVIYMLIAACFFARLGDRQRNDGIFGQTAYPTGFAGLIWFFWGVGGQSYEARWNGEKNIPIYERFYQFVFGTEREDTDPLEDRTRCAQLIRAKRGIITAYDWLMVTGKPLKDCENDLARFTAEFNGTVEILENGTLCYCFEDLMKSSKSDASQPNDSKPPQNAWLNLDAPIPLCGSQSGSVCVFNAINLIMSLIFIKAGPWIIALLVTLMTTQYGQNFHAAVEAYQPVSLWLGSIPFAFSLLIFVAPLCRLPNNRRINKIRRERAIRKALLPSVFSPTLAAPRFTLKQAFNNVAASFKHANFPAPYMDEVYQALNEISHEFDAERDVEEHAYFNFRSFFQKTTEVAQEREKRALDKQAFGNVAFSTDSDEQSELDHSNAMRDFDKKLGLTADAKPLETRQTAHTTGNAPENSRTLPDSHASDKDLLAFAPEDASRAVPNFLDSLKNISDDEYEKMYATSDEKDETNHHAPAMTAAASGTPDLSDMPDAADILAGLKNISDDEYEKMYATSDEKEDPDAGMLDDILIVSEEEYAQMRTTPQDAETLHKNA
ncbi:MAG: hypothetical protein IJ268_06955 [Proteobacteria bacterium]|nr:hypothetical protein [Pseudomonadota bacterium]